MGQILYIDREAVKVTGALTSDTANTQPDGTVPQYFTVTRGWYRSKQEPHQGWKSGMGPAITPYPRKLNERKVWLRFGLNANSDADCVTVFRGTVRNFGWKNGAFILNCEDGQSELAQPLFRDINDIFFQTPEARGPNQPEAQNVDLSKSTGLVLGKMASPFPIQTGHLYALIGDSIVRLSITGGMGTNTSDGLAYGLAQSISSPSDFCRLYQWDQSAGNTLPVRPVVIVTHGSTTSTDTEADLPWLGPFVTVSPGGVASQAPADHPLIILLQILLSSGTATGVNDFSRASSPGINGTYDVLPEGWGLGLSMDEVDVAGIETLAAAGGPYSAPRVRIIVTDIEPDARDWIIKQLLLPFGYCLVTKADGTIGVASLADLTPDQLLGLPSIDKTDLVVDDKGQFAKYQGPESDGIDQPSLSIDFKDTPYISGGAVQTSDERTINLQLGSDAPPPATQSAAKPLSIEALGLYTLNDFTSPIQNGQPGSSQTSLLADPGSTFSLSQALKGPAGAPSGNDVVASLLAQMAHRFGVPPAKLTLEVGAWLWGVGVGDIVVATFPDLPSFTNIGTGWQDVSCEVIQRTPKPQTASVELVLALCGVGLGNIRYLAPSAIITAVSTVGGITTVTCQANAFTLASSGKTDLDGFANGYAVRLYSSDREQRTTAVTMGGLSAGGTTFTFSGSPPTMDLSGRAPAVGDLVLLGDYADQVAAAKSRYAYRAPASPALLGGTDQPDAYY